MCQLLGMNCNVPTDIVFSLTGFQQRGGVTDEHADGWGIAFFEGKGCRVFLDPGAGRALAGGRVRAQLSDPIAQRHRAHPQGHARAGRPGEHASVHARAVGPLLDLRAQRHAGGLPSRLPGERYRPVGTTDSEAAFCELLEHLCLRFPNGAPTPMPSRRKSRRGRAALAISGRSTSSYRDGERLFAHCSTQLAYIERRAPFTKARLVDADLEVDFSQVTTPQDRVAVIATAPLTDNEQWTTLAAGELAVFHQGPRVQPRAH